MRADVHDHGAAGPRRNRWPAIRACLPGMRSRASWRPSRPVATAPPTPSHHSRMSSRTAGPGALWCSAGRAGAIRGRQDGRPARPPSPSRRRRPPPGNGHADQECRSERTRLACPERAAGARLGSRPSRRMLALVPPVRLRRVDLIPRGSTPRWPRPRDAAAVTIALVPANLTTQYKDAELRFREAASHDAKREALREMIALLPKHKGTEKLHADLKKRLAKLEEEGEHVARSAAHRADPAHVRREGAGQWVLFGPPNAGKSSLLAALTHAPRDRRLSVHHPCTATRDDAVRGRAGAARRHAARRAGPHRAVPAEPRAGRGRRRSRARPDRGRRRGGVRGGARDPLPATSGRARGPCRPARRRSSRAGRSSSSRRGGTSTTTARSRRSRARPSDRTCRSSRSPPRAATVSTRSGPSSSARSSASASTRRSPGRSRTSESRSSCPQARPCTRSPSSFTRRRRAPQVRPHLGPRALRRAAGRA